MEKLFKQEEILANLMSNDKTALEDLFNYYYPRLFRFSKTFLKFDDGIDDILQEVFIKIWDNRQNIKTNTSFNSYIFTITQNLLLNELRRRLNNQKIKDQILRASIAQEYHSFESFEYEELRVKTVEFIEELPVKQKEIFKLSRVEGLSHKEIAERLNISTKTVEYHIGQAISQLRKKYRTVGLISALYLYLFL
ncbi:RNA polymerase sigma-70 factor [Sunxiuqinia sp. A32]|uniref:RNA polymerase sigma-70 factor n=1 Tax=Sunxiuqinia sp. A32 TaxID=3461496 RepID=UPI004045FA4C